MTTSKQITTTELDFDSIKENLKTFLRSQDTLTDYEYDGSVMSVLLDVLAYNTHYNSLYTNLAINEMFIDSASKRASVISIAKLMGYRSKSIISARAKINIQVVPSSNNTSSSFTLPAGTVFATTIGTDIYKFCTVDAVSATRVNTTLPFYFTDLTIIEGTRSKLTYTKNNISSFVVPERTADISTLSIRVFDNSTTYTSRVFNIADSIMHVKSTDNIYFVKQREDLFYEIYFGDGVFGSALMDGNLVTMEYSLSHGVDANKANTFVYSSGADSAASYYVSTTQVAQGGAAEETIDSIRFNAPKSFTAAHRAVTADDYISTLLGNFSTIECVNVWGGQDNVPPVYGKVFIAAKPFGRDSFTPAEKTTMIQTILGSRSVVTVKPEFIDPQYLDVELTTNVYYNPKQTTNGSTELSTIVSNVISNYSTTLGKFNTVYRHSAITRLIDTSEKSIISNISTVMVRYTVAPVYNTAADYNINTGNPISITADALVKSTRFYHINYADKVFIQNVGTVLNLYTESIDGIVNFVESVGYYTAAGKIIFTKLNIVGLYDAKFSIAFTPYSYDVVPINNYIVRLSTVGSTINIIVDNVSLNSKHVFSNSR